MRLLRNRRRVEVWAWLVCAAVTSSVALAGASFGYAFIRSGGPSSGFVDSLANGNGRDYKRLMERGYDYKAHQPSLVAFFPVYPIVAKTVSIATGLNSAAALVVLSNCCCLAAFVLMRLYLRERGMLSTSPRPFPIEGAGDVGGYGLLAMGLLPTTFFFRMAYSESMFLCVAILAMTAIVRGWRIAFAALIAGFATAVRPVGIALLLPLAWYACQTSASKRQAVGRLAYALPLGCWGLLAYMVYQYYAFGEPLAFALTQAEWHLRPSSGVGEKLLSLLSLEPVWSVYVPGGYGYWRGFGQVDPLFSLQFANPIYFVGTGVLVALGAWRRWLTSYEVLFSVPLMGIPYFTRSYEMCMESHARFAAVVFPVYIVLGILLARMSTAISVSVLAVSGVVLAVNSALFAAGLN